LQYLYAPFCKSGQKLKSGYILARAGFGPHLSNGRFSASAGVKIWYSSTEITTISRWAHLIFIDVNSLFIC